MIVKKMGKKIVHCKLCNPEIIAFALNNLTNQKLRTYLTLIGVIIGIAAIITFIALGEGLKNSVESEFESLGANTIFVAPSFSGQGTGSNFEGLKESDLRKILRIPEVESIFAPLSDIGEVEYSREKNNISILGTNIDELIETESIGFVDIGEGRNLTESDVFASVIGYDIAKEYYTKEVRIKDHILIEGYSFKVVGITKKSSTSFGGGPNTNASIFIPKKSFKQVFVETNPTFLIVKARSQEEVTEAEEEINRVLEKIFGREQKDYTAVSSEQILESVGQVLGLIQMFLVAIAAVSLVVGGVGIMNTMIMSVMERTSEIGVMKALGATNIFILLIFIFESGFIGLIGGAIGVTVGYTAAIIIAYFSNSSGFAILVIVEPMLILGALLFSVLVGMISGAYPARRASLLDPVEALRGKD